MCSISQKSALKSSLITSAASGRRVLPEFAAKCESTGKYFLLSELERSAASGRLVDRRILDSSSISGKLVEAELLSTCAFTRARALPEELAISDLSGLPYRKDQQVRSQLSGRTAHSSEAAKCAVSATCLLIDEGEVCAVTNSRVSPGMLEVCEVSGQRVLRGQLARSSVSGKQALARLMIESSISCLPLLQTEAVRALSGNPCTPAEAIECGWSARSTHPEDVRVCGITGLKLHRHFVGSNSPFELQVLRELLDGVDRGTDADLSWSAASAALARAGLKGELRIAAARFSPSRDRIAGVVEIKNLFGLRTTWAGFVYRPSTDSLFGIIRAGKRTSRGWLASE